VWLCRDMAGQVKEQQPGEVFLGVLSDLVKCGQVVLDAGDIDRGTRTTIVGRRLNSPEVYWISTEAALAAVNECLGKQGRPLLKTSPQTLIAELRRSGKLLGADGNPLSADDVKGATCQQYLSGERKRGFIMRSHHLYGS
jgi:hypothetical protein